MAAKAAEKVDAAMEEIVREIETAADEADAIATEAEARAAAIEAATSAVAAAADAGSVMRVFDGRTLDPVASDPPLYTTVNNGVCAFAITLDRRAHTVSVWQTETTGRIAWHTKTIEPCLTLRNVTAVYLGHDREDKPGAEPNSLLAISGDDAVVVGSRVAKFRLAPGEHATRFGSDFNISDLGAEVTRPALTTTMATYTLCGQDDIRLPHCFWGEMQRARMDPYDVLWGPFGRLFGEAPPRAGSADWEVATALGRASAVLTGELVRRFGLAVKVLATPDASTLVGH